MGIEEKVNTLLSRAPFIKKVVKRTYQLGMYAISPKIKSSGQLERVTPYDEYEYFFGYYDKSPWDSSERYMLSLRVKDTTKSVAPEEPAEIILIDTKNDNSFEVLGTTRTWNIQQGCMLQWLGPDFTNDILFNDFRDGEYCSVILNIHTKKERVLQRPVYSVSEDGAFALTLDFSRLHRMRPGYGYANKPDGTAEEKIPNQTCIWHLDIEKNQVTPILDYTDFADFESRKEMEGAEHKVNHIMLNPSGTRFMVLHRWYQGQRKYTRLVTANIDGSNLYNLSDDDMTSHCSWKSDTEILAFAHKEDSGNGYYLMKDETKDYQHMWPDLTMDGHPSYSPDRTKVVTDTYPNRSRVASVYILKNQNVNRIAQVFAPFKYDNDVRCDLHPRWNRSGDKVCIDSVFEGKRNLYIVKGE